jgi:hypothetical protein
MTKREAVAELERDIATSLRMIIAAGRGKAGKSVCLRLAIEQHIARGSEPVIADADRTNPTLLAFFPGDCRRT